MTKVLEKFAKIVKKLDNFYVLKEENNYFIVGTEVIIPTPCEYNTSMFQSYVQNVEKTFYISVMLVIKEDEDVIEEYNKKRIPILIIPSHLKSSNLRSIQNYLDEYIKNKIIGA